MRRKRRREWKIMRMKRAVKSATSSDADRAQSENKMQEIEGRK